VGQHVVEKPDARAERARTVAVEREIQNDLRLGSFAGKRGQTWCIHSKDCISRL
jgi:hypothetical protein